MWLIHDCIPYIPRQISSLYLRKVSKLELKCSIVSSILSPPSPPHTPEVLIHNRAWKIFLVRLRAKKKDSKQTCIRVRIVLLHLNTTTVVVVVVGCIHSTHQEMDLSNLKNINYLSWKSKRKTRWYYLYDTLRWRFFSTLHPPSEWGIQ